jgi:hypothetical protein
MCVGTLTMIITSIILLLVLGVSAIINCRSDLEVFDCCSANSAYAEKFRTDVVSTVDMPCDNDVSSQHLASY